jgi:hypothetical protein
MILILAFQSNACRNIDLSFRRYALGEHEGRKIEYESPSEMLEGKHKHFVDDVRYDCAFPFTYQPLERSIPGWVEDYEEKTLAEESEDWRSWFGRPLAPQPEGENGL